MTTLTLAEYIEKNNTHYYATRDPLGAGGDFITAPEISQIFGEAIGLWCANEWLRLGSPPEFTLLEMGGGRGTLMADALRAITQVLPECVQAARLYLLETCPVLRAKQQEKLKQYNSQFLSSLTECHPEHSEGSPLISSEILRGVYPERSRRAQDDKPVCVLPPAPTIIIANEFFDALPVNQYRCVNGEWQMRGVHFPLTPPLSRKGRESRIAHAANISATSPLAGEEAKTLACDSKSLVFAGEGEKILQLLIIAITINTIQNNAVGQARVDHLDAAGREAGCRPHFTEPIKRVRYVFLGQFNGSAGF